MAGRPQWGVPDWRDDGAYEALLRAERAALAWEWLRRQPDYRTAAPNGPAVESAKHGRSPACWGLATFEDPRLAIPHARPIWLAGFSPWVLAVDARPALPGADSFDAAALSQFARSIANEKVEQLLLSDGYRSIRLDVSGEKMVAGPVRLSFTLSGLESLARPLLTLARLRSLTASGRFAASLNKPSHRSRRLVQILRTGDALAEGASQADIADALLALHGGRDGWRLHSPSIRLQAQRLVRAARTMQGGAYRALLD